ncbi:TPR repeat-containing protein [Reticulomyxa filosa]|uniref:TPR repeat-containing protein n=1 Tax=Reticulomyxa filosa TaxID=46433 RepID=X6MY66_RETFI|nr:TPR repeat-containing protein [Reticulomyxa filosa]|eukprot:ETO18025.1 TPR repeat-containing protein [Reticulomyxa filosa]
MYIHLFIYYCIEVEEAKEQTRELIEMTGGKVNPLGPMPEALTCFDYAEAAECLEKIIDSNLLTYCTVQPIDLSEVYYRLQLSYEKLHRYEDALHRMSKLCTLTPNATQPHVECGRLAMLCQEYELAERHLLKALELEPLDTHVKYQLALAQFHIGVFLLDPRKFTFFYCNNNKRKSKNFFFLLKIGDTEACEKNLKDILELKPGDTKSLHLQIQIYMQQKKWNDALQIIDSMLHTHHPNSAYTHYQKGVILEHMNNPQESRLEFEKTVHLWNESLSKLGFSGYFAPRSNERKALQKIQLRCEQHKDDNDWQSLCLAVFNVGMTN